MRYILLDCIEFFFFFKVFTPFTLHSIKVAQRSVTKENVILIPFPVLFSFTNCDDFFLLFLVVFYFPLSFYIDFDENDNFSRSLIFIFNMKHLVVIFSLNQRIKLPSMTFLLLFTNGTVKQKQYVKRCRVGKIPLYVNIINKNRLNIYIFCYPRVRIALITNVCL